MISADALEPGWHLYVSHMYLGAAEVRAQRVSQAHNDGTDDKVKRSDFGLTWKDMPKATW